MQIVIRELFQAFPSHEVAIKPRPDGKLLLTLSQGGQATLSKAIERDAVFCQQRVRAVIRDLLRDIKLASGEVSIAHGSQWVLNDLPTFTGGPIQQTASKTLFARRKLDARKAAARQSAAV